MPATHHLETPVQFRRPTSCIATETSGAPLYDAVHPLTSRMRRVPALWRGRCATLVDLAIVGRNAASSQSETGSADAEPISANSATHAQMMIFIYPWGCGAEKRA